MRQVIPLACQSCQFSLCAACASSAPLPFLPLPLLGPTLASPISIQCSLDSKGEHSLLPHHWGKCRCGLQPITSTMHQAIPLARQSCQFSLCAACASSAPLPFLPLPFLGPTPARGDSALSRCSKAGQSRVGSELRRVRLRRLRLQWALGQQQWGIGWWDGHVPRCRVAAQSLCSGTAPRTTNCGSPSTELKQHGTVPCP